MLLSGTLRGWGDSVNERHTERMGSVAVRHTRGWGRWRKRPARGYCLAPMGYHLAACPSP